MKPKPDFTSKKILLNKVLQNKHNVYPVLNKLIIDIHYLTTQTYQFIRLYLLHLYKQNIPLPVIDDTFIKYCIKTLGTRSTQGRKPQQIDMKNNLDDFYNTHYQPIFSHEKVCLKNKTHIINYLATQMCTCYTNNIKERFTKHFYRFAKTTLECDDKSKVSSFVNTILNCKPTDDFQEWQNKHLHHILPDKTIKKSVYYDVEADPLPYLNGMMYMGNVLESLDKKLFQCCPLTGGFIPKHITLDTSCIIDLFCPEGCQKSKLFKTVKQSSRMVWDNFLKIDSKVFRKTGYTFFNQISTDGISVSIVFIRNDLKDKKWGQRSSKIPVIVEPNPQLEQIPVEKLQDYSTHNIVGCDPGKRSLVYMVDSHGNKVQYTAPQRNFERRSKRNHKVLLKEKENNNICKAEEELSNYNSKTLNIDDYKEYLEAYNTVAKNTETFYNKEVWRKMKFRVYSYGNKSIDTFLNKIQEKFGEKILIGYGNWSRSTQMKNFMPTMGKGLRKIIDKRFETITVNEAYTSQKCCNCHSQLEYYRNEQKEKVFRLLCCFGCVRSEIKQTIYKTRDWNSAVNIRNLTKEWIQRQTRPESFCKPRPSPQDQSVEPLL